MKLHEQGDSCQPHLGGEEGGEGSGRDYRECKRERERERERESERKRERDTHTQRKREREREERERERRARRERERERGGGRRNGIYVSIQKDYVSLFQNTLWKDIGYNKVCSLNAEMKDVRHTHTPILAKNSPEGFCECVGLAGHADRDLDRER